MIIKRAALQRDDTKAWFYLPPFSLNVRLEPDSLIDIRRNPVTGIYRQVLNQQTGWKISVSGIYKAAGDYDGLLFQEAFWAFLRGSTLTSAPKFHLVDWVDPATIVKRFFLNCYLAEDLKFERVKGERVKSFSLGLIGTTTAPAAVSTDNTQPGQGPYEIFYPSSIAGGWPTGGIGGGTGGNGGNSGGSGNSGAGTVVIVEKGASTATLIFPDRIDAATGANNVASRQIRWIPDPESDVVIKSIQIAGGGAPAGMVGQTTIVVSDQDYTHAATANKITVSVPYNSNYSDAVSGSFTIHAGAPLYAYITAAARHQNLEIMLGVTRL